MKPAMPPLSRARIMARVRKTDISAFFKSPEIQMRARTRSLARVAASRVYVPEAANDAEAAMQEEVLSICEAIAHGGGEIPFPPSRRTLKTGYLVKPDRLIRQLLSAYSTLPVSRNHSQISMRNGFSIAGSINAPSNQSRYQYSTR